MSREQSKARTRERIARAARASFAAHGFEGTTVRAIATAARVGTGTVLLHFGSKVDLLVALWVEEIGDALAAQLATLPDGPVERRICHLFHGFYRTYGDRPELARIYVQQLLAVPADHARPYDELTDRFVDLLAAMLAGAGLRPDVDPPTLARAVFGLYVLDLASFLREPTDADVATAATEDRITRLLRPLRDAGPAAAPRA
jgi:AcrR family transcriptional regulator